MNDLWAAFLNYPVEYGFYYLTRIVWTAFTLMIFRTCLGHATRIWETHRWWMRQKDGLGLQAKLAVSEGLYANAIWKTIASTLLVASAILADYTALFGQLPRPEVATQNAATVMVLIAFAFCFYRAVDATAGIDRKLRTIEIAQQEASAEDVEGDEGPAPDEGPEPDEPDEEAR